MKIVSISRVLARRVEVFGGRWGGGNTHARDRRPVQASINGERPIELQIAAAINSPVEALLIVARSQDAPTMRARAKVARKKKPLFVRRP